MAEVIGTTDKTANENTSLLNRFIEVDGDIFPTFPGKIPVADHVRNLRAMSMREDDIIIAAFPKCGTHWIWEVTQMLVSGKAEYDTRPKEEVMMEFVEVEHFELLTSPRVINSHLFLRQLSREIATKKPRIINVIRNPKDTAVSTYFHLIQMKGFETVEKMGFIEFGKMFLKGGFAPGSFVDYFSYMTQMATFLREHPDIPVVTIYFEDAKEDPVKCVRQLAEFLQVDASERLCAEVAVQCSFHKLKEADETTKVKKQSNTEQMFKTGKAKLFRKGEVGDWKNYFTVALSEEYDRVVPDKLKGLGIKTRYSI